uniref:Uncharacterized protein n=1 Tax=Chromera velia CCMP2878 TaxID=1169474 RepID=A0A0G4F873_9ALVE|eukprot:Cvel_15739.t1-p1 / transcript=Cvel_15739.t1 / gene=Cvel_15739 / organism=Chromera_velia_CCMP2878 / gene_product=hypothetical protein / transcript_product=hypothetical protein / location=Cvel_scaffold1177:48426-48629(-) / protein_length=68 / sequence_SO=supercontig / SO=protein_coding / is_pseudo=false
MAEVVPLPCFLIPSGKPFFDTVNLVSDKCHLSCAGGGEEHAAEWPEGGRGKKAGFFLIPYDCELEDIV